MNGSESPWLENFLEDEQDRCFVQEVIVLMKEFHKQFHDLAV